MRILLLSDIHANFEALRRLKIYIDSADLVLCLGDIVGYNCAVNESIDFLRQHSICCIQGNHDRYLIEGLNCQTKFLNDSVRFGIEYAQGVIRSDNLEWLKSLPISLGLNIESISLLMSHGSPFDPLNGYVYVNNTDFSLFEKLHYNLIAIGHTHRELMQCVGNVFIVNPGSVGQARDYEGKVCACYFDTQTREIERIRIEYDYMKNLSLILSCGGGDWIYKHYKQVLK